MTETQKDKIQEDTTEDTTNDNTGAEQQQAENSEAEDDAWGIEEPEDSNEVLLAEIRREEEEERAKADELAREDARLEQEALERGKQYIKPGQLSPFQETLISTGSGVGYALVVVLVILFFIKLIETLVKYVQRRSKLARVRKALDTTKETHIDEYNGDDRLEFVKFNSPFVTGEEMDDKIRGGFRDFGVLSRMLRERALEVVRRRFLIMKEDSSVQRGYVMDLVPMEVWNDFLDAKQSLGDEIQKLQVLCEKMQVPFKDLMNEAHSRYNREQLKGGPNRNKASKLMKQRRLQNADKNSKKGAPDKVDSSASASGPTAQIAQDDGNLRRRRKPRGRMRFGGKKSFS